MQGASVLGRHRRGWPRGCETCFAALRPLLTVRVSDPELAPGGRNIGWRAALRTVDTANPPRIQGPSAMVWGPWRGPIILRFCQLGRQVRTIRRDVTYAKLYIYAGLIVAVPSVTASLAQATYHVMVIEQVFHGLAHAPGAQYVVLRVQANLQTFVHGQAVTLFEGNGDAAGTFARFCPDIRPPGRGDLPLVTPACGEGGCPSPLSGNDSRILVATAWARDLFCITPDLLASGLLPHPNGRVCFADTGPFAGGCIAAGPVDCVAYGEFTGDRGVFGSPARAPVFDLPLVASRVRPSQCNAAALAATGLCVGGAQANAPCESGAQCPRGFCQACPQPNCETLLDNSAGFFFEDSGPLTNFRGDVGDLGGVAGDADGDGGIDRSIDLAAAVLVLFDAERRCELADRRQGADANLDTRLGAADLVLIASSGN